MSGQVSDLGHKRALSDGEPAWAADASGPSLTTPVASPCYRDLAHRLAVAVLDGDLALARQLAGQVLTEPVQPPNDDGRSEPAVRSVK